MTISTQLMKLGFEINFSFVTIYSKYQNNNNEFIQVNKFKVLSKYQKFEDEPENYKFSFGFEFYYHSLVTGEKITKLVHKEESLLKLIETYTK